MSINKSVTSFYTEEELSEIGLKSYGKDVKISRFARIYSPELITIGNNVRIDDFCILSGNIVLGSNIHISPYVVLYGANCIEMQDFTGISARSTIYSAMDDFGGDYLIGPIHDEELTNVTGGKVLIEKFVQIGAHCLIFPKLTIREGTVVGACSLVNKSLDEWGVYWGTPALRHKGRSRKLLDLICKL